MEVLGFQLPLWLLLILLVGILFYLYSTWTFDTFQKIGISGPKPWPFFGNQPELFSMGPNTYYLNLKKTYGNVYGTFEGRTPLLVVFDPEIIKQFLIKEFKTFTNRRALPVFDPPLDQSVLQLKDDAWKRTRSLITPAFTTGKLRQMTSQINACIDLLLQNLASFADSSESVQFKKFASAFTNDAISRIAFGIELDAQRNPDHPVLQNAGKFFKIDPVKTAFAFTFPDVVNFFRYKLGFRIFNRKELIFFRKLMDKLIKERTGDNQEHVDFLQMMLKAHDTPLDMHVDEDIDQGGLVGKAKGHTYTKLSADELTAQTVLFFLGGTDTTASTLTFLCHSLATNPDIQTRLIKDIDDAIGQAEFVNFDMCSKVPFLKQCVQETLRLYPPFKRLDRICSKDTTIKGYRIPAGLLVAAPTAAIQKDPEFWDRPEVFDPDRFNEEQQASRDPLLFMAFGHGPRNCLGKRLALMEVEIAAVRLLQKFQFYAGPDTENPVQLDNVIITQPKNPVFFRMRKRN